MARLRLVVRQAIAEAKMAFRMATRAVVMLIGMPKLHDSYGHVYAESVLKVVTVAVDLGVRGGLDRATQVDRLPRYLILLAQHSEIITDRTAIAAEKVSNYRRRSTERMEGANLKPPSCDLRALAAAGLAFVGGSFGEERHSVPANLGVLAACCQDRAVGAERASGGEITYRVYRFPVEGGLLTLGRGKSVRIMYCARTVACRWGNGLQHDMEHPRINGVYELISMHCSLLGHRTLCGDPSEEVTPTPGSLFSSCQPGLVSCETVDPGRGPSRRVAAPFGARSTWE